MMLGISDVVQRYSPMDLSVLTLLVLVLIFVVVRKARPAGKTVAVVVGVLLIAGALLLLGLRATTFSTRPTLITVGPNGPVAQINSTDTPWTPQSARIAADSDNPPAWQEGADLPLEADIYPSKPAAARALARQMASMLAEARNTAGQGAGAVTLKITGEDDSTVTSQFTAALRQASPGIVIDMGPAEAGSTAPPDGKPYVIELSNRRTGISNVTYVTDHSSSTTNIPRGAMQAKLIAPNAGGSIRHAEWLSKPWVDDLSEFRDTDPFNRHTTWFVARSQQMCNSQSEAFNQAYDQAVEHLYQQVTANLPQLSPADRMAAGLQGGEAQLRSRLAAEVRSSRLAADQFSQRFDRPYGTLWRAAVLVDTSPENLQRIVTQNTGIVRARTNSWAWTAGAVVSLAILVCLVYLFLNLATRGYYAGRLRAIVLVIVLAGALLLLFIV